MAEIRLDVLVAQKLECTRSRAEKMIRQGEVRVGGVVVTKPGAQVREDAEIDAELPPPAPMEAKAEEIPLDILYQDEDLAVVVKPRGMVVHPAAGNENGTLVNALLYHLEDLSGIGGTMRPGIVHRLDKDTSGVLLIAKNDKAHLALSEDLKDRRIKKIYRAVAFGRFSQAEGAVEANIARDPKDRKKMAVVSDGRWARTEYTVAEELRGATLLNVRIITGRTHQIRVHMNHLGHPLLGDVIYGPKKPKISVSRLMLHAWQVEFEHPTTHRLMRFEAPEPEDFVKEIEKLRL